MTAYDPFAEFAAFDPKPTGPPAPAPTPPEEKKPMSIMKSHQPMMMQQQQQQPQQQQPAMGANPFGYNAGSPGMAPQMQFGQVPNAMTQQQQQQPPAPAHYQQPAAYQQPGMAPVPQQPTNSMVPAVQQQPNQWGVQQQQPPAPSPYNQPPTPPAYQQPASPPYQQVASPPQQMMPNSNQSLANGSYMTTPTSNYEQQVAPQQQQQASPFGGPAPAAHAAPPAVIQEDDDFFGAFSNTAPPEENASPNRPPSVFEAGANDDVSYLSKSTGGGTERGVSVLDDPKFAPKPPAVHGLANSQALAQQAPPGSSPLPDFEQVLHSGYVLSRISFRTILIKKWKQTFWIMYGRSKVLFFRSSADFEDWISNPYLSQAQRDFLVKLSIDFAGDLNKQGVRGYQVTPQRLKNYNNKMLHQFKLERWMDYGPTIAAAFASPNERELRNLRIIFQELLKRIPQNTATTPRPASTFQYSQSSDQGQAAYGSPRNAQSMYEERGPDQYQHYSSSASTGRLEYGQAGSVHSQSQHSHKSFGVMSAGPVEMGSRDQYVAGYRVSNAQSPPGHY